MKLVKHPAFLIASLLTIATWLMACDDITKPIKKTSVPFTMEPHKAPEPVDPMEEFTRQKMERLYAFIEATRDSVREMGNRTLQARGVDREAYITGKAEYQAQRGAWLTMITSRQNNFKLEGLIFPEGHPAPSLEKALRLLQKEMDSFYGDMYINRPYNPVFDEKLVAELRKARSLLDSYQER